MLSPAALNMDLCDNVELVLRFSQREALEFDGEPTTIGKLKISVAHLWLSPSFIWSMIFCKLSLCELSVCVHRFLISLMNNEHFR